MNRKSWMSLIGLIVVLSMLLTACAQPTPTPAPKPTEAPKAAAPAATQAPAPTKAPEPTKAPAAPTQAPAATKAPEPTKAAAGPAKGGTMTGGFDVGPGGFPERFDAWNSTAGYYWFDMYLAKLVAYSDTTLSKMTGDLAESWEISPDGKTYTFKLRKGLKFHDGSPLTADDVKFTLDSIAVPGVSTFAAKLATVKGYQDVKEGKATSLSGVEVIDATTVKVTHDKPNAAFLDGLSFMYIMPKASLGKIPVKELANNAWWSTNPIGAGPFKWSKYVKGQYVELVRFDDYWRGAPLLEKLVNRYFPEAGTAVLALQKGEIDFTYVTADEMLKLKTDPKITVISGPSLVNLSIYFNKSLPAFQDKQVRQAFMYAIDRETIRKALWKETAKVVNCNYGLDAFTPKDLTPYAYDPKKAKALLDAAKFDYSKEYQLLTYYGDQLTKDILAAVQQNLADVGVKITPRFVDTPTFNSEFYNKEPKWSLIYAGSGNGPDPDVHRNIFSTAATWPAGNNAHFYSNPEVDKALDAGVAEMDPAKRPALYQNVCRLLNEDVPWAFLWESIRYGATTGKIGNFVYTPAPGGGRFYSAVETWYIKQ